MAPRGTAQVTDAEAPTCERLEYKFHMVYFIRVDLSPSLDQPGYEVSISSLVQVTCDLVSDKFKVTAQRASREAKINASVE